MKISKKYLFLFLRYLLFLFALIIFFAETVGAEEMSDFGNVPQEYTDLLAGLPGDISDNLLEGVYSKDIDEVGEAITKMSTAEYLLSAVKSALSLGIKDATSLFASLSGVLVISAVFSAFKTSFASEAISKAVSFASSCAVFGSVISVQIGHFERVGEFFERLGIMVGKIIPLTTIVYAMGGNVVTASASSSTLYIFLAFCEDICRTSVLPIASVCTAFALCSSFSSNINLHGISSAIKKCYTFVLGLVMTILLATLSGQTVLSSSADTVSARAAKLVASNIIPIVGSSVGETLRTVSSSVGYLKSVSGVGAIIFILLLVLPTLITLLLSRAVFIISVSIAELLGCENESKLLSELGTVYGLLVAVVTMCSVMFILALTIFVRCTVAAG